MPIYEFYCLDCHTIFNFLSKTVNTSKRPMCPSCKKRQLQREVSMFAQTGEATESADMDDLPIDESRMASAMEAIAGEAEGINEEDPRQAAQIMRKFSHMTGLEFGGGIEEALGRIEAGEDPEAIETEMGDRLENEEPFVLPSKGTAGEDPREPAKRGAPRHDKTLYDM